MTIRVEDSDAFSRATIRQLPASRLRVVHFRGGELVYETPIATADIAVIGAHMAGHH